MVHCTGAGAQVCVQRKLHAFPLRLGQKHVNEKNKNSFMVGTLRETHTVIGSERLPFPPTASAASEVVRLRGSMSWLMPLTKTTSEAIDAGTRTPKPVVVATLMATSPVRECWNLASLVSSSCSATAALAVQSSAEPPRLLQSAPAKACSTRFTVSAGVAVSARSSSGLRYCP